MSTAAVTTAQRTALDALVAIGGTGTPKQVAIAAHGNAAKSQSVAASLHALVKRDLVALAWINGCAVFAVKS